MIGQHLLVLDFRQIVPAIDFNNEEAKGCLDASNAARMDCFIVQQLKQGDCHFHFNSIDFLLMAENLNCANFGQNTSGSVELAEIVMNAFTSSAEHLHLAYCFCLDMFYFNFDYRIDLASLKLS